MGLYGAIIVLPATHSGQLHCTTATMPATNQA